MSVLTLDVLGAFDAFKPLSKVVVKADFSPNGWSSSFNEAFFIAATECGVRSMQFESEPLRAALAVDLLPALSFVFAKPTSGDDRSISGADCKVDGDDFLAQLIKVVSWHWMPIIGCCATNTAEFSVVQ